MKRSGSIENKIIPASFMAILLVIWQLLVDRGVVARFLLPSPKDIAVTFVKILPDIGGHVYVTVREAFIGFVISIVISIVLAVLMDSIQVVHKAIYPILLISQTIPTIALAPLFILWFGFGQLPKVIMVVLVCFFPIVVSLLDGLNSVDRDMLNLMKSMGAGKIQIFKLVKFPASMVNFFSGLRIAATYSIMGAVVGEWLGGDKGLGVYMIRVKHSYALDKLFAAILIIVLLSMALFKLISLLQGWLMPWHRLSNNNTGRE